MGFNTNNEISKFFLCCKNCTRRCMNCHDKCEDYLNGKNELIKYKIKKEQEKLILTKRQMKYMGRKQI